MSEDNCTCENCTCGNSKKIKVTAPEGLDIEKNSDFKDEPVVVLGGDIISASIRIRPDSANMIEDHVEMAVSLVVNSAGEEILLVGLQDQIPFGVLMSEMKAAGHTPDEVIAIVAQDYMNKKHGMIPRKNDRVAEVILRRKIEG